MCIKKEKKQHMQRQMKKTYIITHTHTHTYVYVYIKDKHNVCKYGHKIGVQEEGSKHSP